MFEADTAGEKAAVRPVPKVRGTEREMRFTSLDGVRNVVPIVDRHSTITWSSTVTVAV
ncbi:hypothetical protein [Streptomyces sp. 11x1]|uniref:hypothetical protein n=1 Tax=Streptomyces sp. 11x1 TaxID=3038642 RepID=UPI00292EE28A|nr:hypothetical protein [Streptomyces sp. 11x1]WNZ06229.1 hypothetical protein P8T65_00520 [Streptomyces sp. 11x1]